MNTEPEKAYVYQPMPPRKDGRFYGVAGLSVFGVDHDYRLFGITKEDAEKIAAFCNENPSEAAEFIEWAKGEIDADWRPECGCRFESIFSNGVLLCSDCAKQPCHHKGHPTPECGE